MCTYSIYFDTGYLAFKYYGYISFLETKYKLIDISIIRRCPAVRAVAVVAITGAITSALQHCSTSLSSVYRWSYNTCTAALVSARSIGGPMVKKCVWPQHISKRI